jgi:hypothetical protein
MRIAIRTAPEAIEALGSVCVPDAVAEGIELVAGKRQQWWLRYGKLPYACNLVLTESSGY